MKELATTVKKDSCSHGVRFKKLIAGIFASVLAVLSLCSPSHSLSLFTSGDISQNDDLSITNVEFLPQQAERRSLEYIQQEHLLGKFKKLVDHADSFYQHRGSYWLRFSLANTSDKLLRVWLETRDATSNNLTLYHLSHTGIISKQTQSAYALSKPLLTDPLKVIPIELQAHRSSHYYLYISNLKKAPIIPKIVTEQTHADNVLNINRAQGLIFGSLLVIFAFMLMNNPRRKGMLSLYFFAMLASCASHALINMGLHSTVNINHSFTAGITPNISTAVYLLTSSLFVRKLLTLAKSNPSLDRCLLIAVGISLLALVTSNLSSVISDPIVLIATILVSALTAAAAFLHMRTERKPASFIVAGSIGVLLPSVTLLWSPTELLSILSWNNLFNFSLALQVTIYAGALRLGVTEKKVIPVTAADKQDQQVFQSHHSPIAGDWYWDTQTDDYYMSENIYKILPFAFTNTENAINKVFTQIDPREKIRLSRAFFKAQSEGSGFHGNFKLTNETNSERSFLVNAGFQKNTLNENTSRLIGTLHDITDYKASGIADNDHEIRWREIADSTFESILIFQDKRIIDANSACEALFGYTPRQLIGTTGSSLFSATQLSSLPLNSSNAHEDVREFTLKHLDGTDIHVEVRTKSRKFQKRPIQTLAIRDVSRYKKQEEQLRKLGYTDNLTGLHNRALFQDHLQLAIDKAQRVPQKHALLYIDLDQFKHINDSLGHDVGDELLKEVGRRLMKRVRKIDTLARLGGDEFALLIEDITAPYNAAKVADGVIEAMSDEIIIDDYRLQVSPSIGIAIFPADGTNGGELLRKADTAMYHAKDQGRNNYQFYTEALHDKTVRRMNLESELRVAIERGELFLDYQPQVSLETGSIIGAEALLRWNSAKYGQVSPGEFISIAEENGLIWSIGEFVLEQACKQALPWIIEHATFDHIAVNISGIQFNNSDLVDTIKRVLEESHLPAQHLELEITEGAIIDNANDAIKIMKQLKDIGVKLSLDDFGTGYSSLSYLRKFPVDSLKIDRSFVAEIVTDKSGLIIAENIVNLAHGLNLNVVAEGVETIEQLNIIRNMGCDELQGYIFSKPLNVDDLSNTLANNDNLYSLIETPQ